MRKLLGGLNKPSMILCHDNKIIYDVLWSPYGAQMEVSHQELRLFAVAHPRTLGHLSISGSGHCGGLLGPVQTV